MPRMSQASRLALIAATFQAAIAIGTATTRFFFSGAGPGPMYDDVRIYHEYASKVWQGLVPYRDFVLEYPVVAVPVFLLPKLFAADYGAYKVAFGVEMLLCNAAAVWLVARRVERSEGPGLVAGRLAWYSAFFAALCPLVVTKFDLAPMALSFAAAVAWFSGRSALGGLATGLAVLLKIYPGVLAAPGLVVAWNRRRGRALLALAATVAAGSALWFGVGGTRAFRSLQYHTERGLEIESLYSGILIVISELLRAPIATAYNHFSTELVSPWSASWARLAFPIQAAALLIVLARSWRTRAREPMRDASAAILAFIAFGKVLSPQYVIWLFPFLAVVRGPTGALARPIFLACCLATTLIYPWGIDRLIGFDRLAVLLLNGRNLLLLALWALLLLGPPAPAANADPAGHVSPKGVPPGPGRQDPVGPSYEGVTVAATSRLDRPGELM